MEDFKNHLHKISKSEGKIVENKKIIRNIKPVQFNSIEKGIKEITTGNENIILNGYVDSAIIMKENELANSIKNKLLAKVKSNENNLPDIRNHSNYKNSTFASTQIKELTYSLMKNQFKNSSYNNSSGEMDECNEEKSRNLKNLRSTEYKTDGKNSPIEKFLKTSNQRKIFQQFEIKHGDPNLKSFVDHSSANFIKNLKSNEKSDLDKKTSISPLVTKNKLTKERRVKKLIVSAASQFELNKFLIKNHKIGQISNYLENSK